MRLERLLMGGTNEDAAGMAKIMDYLRGAVQTALACTSGGSTLLARNNYP